MALLLLFLTACAGPSLQNGFTTPSSVVIQRGDTLSGIAQRFNVSQRDIIALNALDPPYILSPGQVLRLPAPEVYRVVSGDTLYGISRRYNIDSGELARSNGILPPYRIYIGQMLRMPTAGGTRVAADGPPFRPPLPPRHQAGATVVARAAPAPVVQAPLPAPAAPVAPTAPPPAPVEEPLPDVVPEQTLPPSETAEVPPAPPTSDPPPRAGSRFRWPLVGEVVSTFGPKGEGAHNDGINIAADRGTPVQAAENGIVAYAGNELRGYGNLILIRHADGWVTAYGHNDRILVQRGEQVAVGQTIGMVGATGAVSTPQLHFEIRRGTQAIDPVGELPPMPRS